jgi:hypothetical protein
VESVNSTNSAFELNLVTRILTVLSVVVLVILSALGYQSVSILSYLKTDVHIPDEGSVVWLKQETCKFLVQCSTKVGMQ